MRVREILDTALRLAREYPAPMRSHQLLDAERIAFNVALLRDALSVPLDRASVADIGGGVGLFTPVLAALGCRRVVLIDDFRDPVSGQNGDALLELHRRLGVEVVSRDVVAEGFPALGGEPLDGVTSFDSMEHFHHSPKRLFRQACAALAPRGVFVLATPNNVNLRKRVSAVLGRSPWTSMDAWYEADVFRGHVREPDVHDLRYIARDVGLHEVRVVGRNWAGRQSPLALRRAGARAADHLLRLRPSLCSDIYMVGRKPADASVPAASSRILGAAAGAS